MPEGVATADVDLPRIAIYTTWANTEKVGWVRLAFDRFEIPFDLIHKDHVQPGARLRVEVRRHRRPAPDPERQGPGLRAAEAVEATALQEARDVQVAGNVRRDRRRARRHGHQGRGRVRRLRRRGRGADDLRHRQLLPHRVRTDPRGGCAAAPGQLVRARPLRAGRGRRAGTPAALRTARQDPARALGRGPAAPGGRIQSGDGRLHRHHPEPGQGACCASRAATARC